MKKFILEDLKELNELTGILMQDSEFLSAFEESVKLIDNALKKNNKILICGNGGSASDAEHMAGELVGRFQKERLSLPCISLCTPSATFSAIANDYGYENVFSRQVEGFGKQGDVLIAISTSGNSCNIVNAIKIAKKIGISVIGLTGEKISEVSKHSDICFKVKSLKTSRIQEIHGLLIHSLCKSIELLLED